MNIADFKASLTAAAPPAGITVYLQALWFDAAGNWQKAHELIQDLPDNNASWLHAYLHRKEGDNANAGYWYRRAGKKNPLVSLEQEWEQIATALL